MRKLKLATCSGLSPLTIPQAAELWGVTRRSAYNFVISGALPLLYSYQGERAWRKLSLEVVVALVEFRGTRTGEPWGARKDWDHGLDSFKNWYAEKVAEGCSAQLISGTWVFGPNLGQASSLDLPSANAAMTSEGFNVVGFSNGLQPQAISGAVSGVGSFQINPSNLGIVSGHS